MTSWDQKERRQYIRIQKPLFISYMLEHDPLKKREVTQLKNLGMGGMCFLSNTKLEAQSHITIEFKAPHFAETTVIQGVILESQEKISNMIYENRVSFEKLQAGESFILKQVIETFLRIAKTAHKG